MHKKRIYRLQIAIFFFILEMPRFGKAAYVRCIGSEYQAYDVPLDPYDCLFGGVDKERK